MLASMIVIELELSGPKANNDQRGKGKTGTAGMY